MISDKVLQRYVTQMARRLDKLLPNPNWRHKVSLKTLNMVSQERCILGQVFGSYAAGLIRLRLTGLEKVAAAFIEPSAHKMWEREIHKVQQ